MFKVREQVYNGAELMIVLFFLIIYTQIIRKLKLSRFNNLY